MIERATDPVHNPGMAVVFSALFPLVTGLHVYEATGGSVVWTAAATTFAVMVGVLLETIIVHLRQILERLPPK